MLDILAMEEKFTGEYKRAFAKISMYGTMTAIDSDKYEDRVMNIYDILLSAQEDGKPVEKIIGRDIEGFCRTYYANHSGAEWIGHIFKRAFRLMLILAVYSLLELVLTLAEDANNAGFMGIEVNAAPFLIGVLVGFVVIGIDNVAKHRLLLKTDKIKNGVFAVGTLIVFAICVAVGIVLFGNLDAKMPLWLMLAISGGYSVLYLLIAGIVRFVKNGTLKNIDKMGRQELKEFNKELTLEYDIKTSAEGMAEQFDKMKKKYAKKGKPEPEYADFVKKMRNDHKSTKYIELLFIVFIVVVSVVNVAINMGSEEMLVAVISAVIVATVTLAIFLIAMKAIGEVEEAQCIILDECEQKGIDIYEYIACRQNESVN